MRKFLSCSLLVFVSLAGCSAPQFVGRPGLTTVRQQALPEPTREDFTIPSRPYVLGPSDQLSIDVFGIPELSKSVTVDLTGQIALPLVGQLKVSGLTAQELSAEIEKRLRGVYVRDPNVTVNISNAASQTVTVDGSVAAPGVYPLVGRMSLMRAIARASGTSEFARENYVVVFRRAGGKDYAALYDLRAIRQGIYEDPEIFSNDIIYVGDSPARRVFKDIIASAPLITTPIIALLN